MTEWIISTSVLILVIVALRYILRGKMSLRLQYALWALVLLRALVPLSFFSSPISVMNAVDRIDTLQLSTAAQAIPPSIEHIEFVPDGGSAPDAGISTGTIQGYYSGDSDKQFPTVIVPNATQQQFQAVEKAMEVQDILLILWICGAILMALVFLCTNLRFGFHLRHSRRELELQGNLLPVYICPGVETPCLFGFFRPAVYLTPGCESDQTVLRHVLAHEFTHYRHGDNIWSVLRCVCVALHWYNPLVWLAAFLSMRDAELACDEGAIKRLGEAERASYGRTLIGMTCRSGNVRALALTATTMTGSKKGIKERIILIAKKPKMAVYTLVAVLLVAAIAVGCTFSGVEEDKVDTDGFTPDYMNISNAISSVINEPTYDPAVVQEFYELYLSLEKGEAVEAPPRSSQLTLGFGSSETDEIQSCTISSEGMLVEYVDGVFRYYELENGEAIYEKLSAQYQKMQLDTLFSPSEVYISRNGFDKELVISDELDVNELYVNFKVCSANGTEIDESKVSKDNAIYVAFTDGQTTRRAILYGDGCYSPEPEEWETGRRYYRMGNYDNCGTQGCYMLFDTYCNMANAKYVRDYVPMIVITGCAEDYDMTGTVSTTVEYYNTLYDRPHTANTNAVSSTAAMWLLSQKGRFETVYLLNATDNTRRAEWLAEDLKLIADNVITDPAEIEAATGWTVLVEKQEGIPLENGLMLRIDNSISKYEDKALLGAASHYIQMRVDELNGSNIEIIDAYLTALTEIPCGAIGGNSGVGSRIFLMEYRLKPQSLNGFFSNDVIVEGDWITQETSKGQPYLIMHCDGAGYSGLSTMITDYDLKNTYSTPEMLEKYYNDPYVAACMEVFKQLFDPEELSLTPPGNYEELPADVFSAAASLVWSDIRNLNAIGETDKFGQGNFEITHAEITKLEQIVTGTTGLDNGVNIYRLEYRLRADNNEAVPELGGIRLENGWLVGGSYGTMYMIFYVQWGGGNISYDHMVSMSEESLEKYNTDAFIEKYDNMYTAACMETLHAWRGAFVCGGSAKEIVEYYAENVYPYEHYMGGAPVGDDPAAITDFKPVSNQLIAVSVTGDKLVGHMSIAVVPLQFEGNAYWGASNGYWGSGEYEGMLVIESFFELQSLGDGRWYCTGTGTGGFGGWGYIPMDFEDDRAVLEELEHYLSFDEGYDENILMLLPLINWAEMERGDFDIDLSELFSVVSRAAVCSDDYYADTYPDDQLYRDLYVMKACFNADGAYSEFLCEILLMQYEHDTAIFDTALRYFSIEQQEKIMDDVAFARG